MKKLLFSLLVVTGYFLSAQHTSFAISDWSSPMAFDWSHPKIRGYGDLSDSLNRIYPDRDFYVFNEKYYAINSWADYYYWFTKKYWYRFNRPVGEYEAYYLIGDDQFMMEFVFSAYDYEKWEVKDPRIRRSRNQIIFNSLVIDRQLLERIQADRLRSVPLAYKMDQHDKSVNNVHGASVNSTSGGGGRSIGGSGSSSGGTTNSGKSIGN